MGIFERVFGCKKKETVHPDLSAARAGDCNARFSYGKACICRSQDSAAIGEGLEWLMRAALKGTGSIGDCVRSWTRNSSA